MRARTLNLILLLLLIGVVPALAAEPRDPAKYTRLLLPFHEGVSAAAGIWRVDWWLHNDGDTALDAFPLAIGSGFPLPPQDIGKVFILGSPALPPHSTPHGRMSDALPTYASSPVVPVVTSGTGAFIYAETTHLAQLAIGGSIQFGEGSASALHAVPETLFVRGVRSILPVPLLNGSRYALRIYALPETAALNSRVRVNIFEMQPLSIDGHELLMRTIDTNVEVPQSSVRPCLNSCDVPAASLAPASAQLFDIAQRDPAIFFSTLRIEIEPDSPLLKWWALVSATENATQSVTLYELQR